MIIINDGDTYSNGNVIDEVKQEGRMEDGRRTRERE
jgi:hypothetical protein